MNDDCLRFLCFGIKVEKVFSTLFVALALAFAFVCFEQEFE